MAGQDEGRKDQRRRSPPLPLLQYPGKTSQQTHAKDGDASGPIMFNRIRQGVDRARLSDLEKENMVGVQQTDASMQSLPIRNRRHGLCRWGHGLLIQVSRPPFTGRTEHQARHLTDLTDLTAFRSPFIR